MNRVILAAFDGKNSTAGMIAERISVPCRRVMLPCDKKQAAKALSDEIKRGETTVIIMLGQKPQICGKIAVEPCAGLDNEARRTGMDVGTVRRLLKEGGYPAYISRGCGSSVCGSVYFEALGAGVNCVMLNVPCAGNIGDIGAAAKAVEGLINGIAGVPVLL